MIDLPNLWQTFKYDCGAKALQIVLAYYGVDIPEDQLISQLGSTPEDTPVANMVSVAERHGFQVEASCETSIDAVKRYVDEGYPVIVLLQEWADGYMTIEDWKKDQQDAHYVIIYKFTENIIVFEDPSSFRRVWMKEEEFVARWHDIDSRTQDVLDKFAMVLKGRKPAAKILHH